MRKLVKVALAAALVVVTVAVIAQPKPEEKKQDEKIAVKVTPEMVRHSKILDTLYFAGTAYSIGVLLLLLLSGASRRLGDFAARLSKSGLWLGIFYFASFLISP